MGKKYPRKRKFNLRSVRTSAQSPDMSALGANTVLVNPIYADPVGAAYRIKSMKATWSMENMDILDGPVIVGYAHGDYTVGEIKECIESGGSIVLGNKIVQEQANRLVRIVGTFSPGVDQADVTLNDGKPITTKLNWLITVGQTFNLFVYNDGSAAIETATKVVKINGQGWVQDL